MVSDLYEIGVSLINSQLRTPEEAKGCPPPLRANKTGVERAGQCDVRGALDQCPTVGEKGDGMLTSLKTQQHLVVANRAVRRQSALHRSEIDGAMMLVNLYGVASAEGDMWTALAPQVDKIVARADGATRSG